MRDRGHILGAGQDESPSYERERPTSWNGLTEQQSSYRGSTGKPKKKSRNIYHLNCEVNDSVFGSAKHYLVEYLKFIERAIEHIKKKQSFTIEIERIEIEKVIPPSSEPYPNQGSGEVPRDRHESLKGSTHNPHSEASKAEQEEAPRYKIYPKAPKNKKEEEVIDHLFGDHVHEVYGEQDFEEKNAIKILDKNPDEFYIVVVKKVEGNKIYLKPNTYQLERQKRAILRLMNEPLREHEPLLYLFGFSGEEYWRWRGVEAPSQIAWKILTDDSIEGVEEQREFVRKALETEDFALMEGPPGSGKTTVIIEYIAQLVEQGKRVMLCSATHAAIDNVIERITGRYKHILGALVVPIRISHSPSMVKESVKPYLLQNIKKTYLEETLQFLRKNNNLPSQKYLLENLDSPAGEHWIEMLILETADLIAGTMIGIRQHPAIKGSRDEMPSDVVPFDVMIVDESSKVTFLDFIVPALYAKKWILVGDIKQLPPYIEENYIAEYIQSFASEEDQKAIMERYVLKEVLSKVPEELVIYFTSREVESECDDILQELNEILARNQDLKTNFNQKNWLSGISKFLNCEPYILTISEGNLEEWKSELGLLALNSADLLICQNTESVQTFIADNIFVKSIVVHGIAKYFGKRSRFTYRQRYLYREPHKSMEDYVDEMFYQYRLDEESWAERVTSKMIQYFSFRDVLNIFGKVQLELSYLLPGELWDKVFGMMRLIFPSILELLQRGATRQKDERRDRIITSGFSPKLLQSRFVSLSYQHRMHPEIAELPSKHFYGGTNLRSSSCVSEERRPWSDPWRRPRILWVPDRDSTGNKKNGRIVNPTEVKNMENELKKFLQWAKHSSRPPGEPYELAILTFYRDQEWELRKMVRKVTGQPKRFTKFQVDNVHIFLYTVDKFQGQEADVVFLGFTKFSPYAHYNSPNRLNVALTRARHKLLLFGNRAWLEKYAKLEALRELAKKSSIKTY